MSKISRGVLFLLFLAMARPAQAQQPAPQSSGQISGTIVDSLTHKPVPYSTISLFKEGNAAPETGVLSDMHGNFSIAPVSAGKYRIRIDLVGYESKYVGHVQVSSSHPRLNLGNIYLAQNSTNLKTVTVTGQADLVENRPDMLVYHADKDITTLGGVATDVLRKVPEVAVDVDGNVELQGDPNVRVLINGKPSSIFGNNLAEALQSIPASQIKDIQVITTPGAKYDADGSAGIINIVLKENNAYGVNGNIILSAGSRLENGSFNLQARQKNFGIHASLSGNAHLYSTTISGLNRNSTDSLGGNTLLVQNGQSAFVRDGYMSQLGFDWDITPRDNLNGSIGYDNFQHFSNGFTNQLETFESGDSSSQQALERKLNNNFNFQSLDWNLSYRKTFNKKNQELDITYVASQGINHAFYVQNQFDEPADTLSSGADSYGQGKNNETDIQADYTQPLSDNTSLEFGAKTVMQYFSNNSGYYDLALLSKDYLYDSIESNIFTYSRNIYAGYASLSFKLFNRLDVQGGVRVERTVSGNVASNGQPVNIPAYNSIVPSIILSYPLDSNHIIRLAYTRRIQRPDFEDINPFINASDPTNISVGNPDLEPELAHRAEISYDILMKKGGALDFNLFYHYYQQDIQSYTTVYPELAIGDSVYTNVAVNTNENVGLQQTIGLNIFGSVPITPDFNVRMNFTLMDKYITNEIEPGNSIHGFDYRVNVNATYQFTKGLVGEFFGNFRSSHTEMQGKLPSFTVYSVALRQYLWHKKASIAATATNPFNNYVYMPTNLTGEGFTMFSYRKIPFRSFGISLSYQFGKMQFEDKKADKDNPDQAPQNTQDN